MSEWQEYRLHEVYTFASGLSKSRQEFGFGYPFLTFKDVFDNYFLPKELTSLANTTDQERNTCSIRKGDVFLTRTSETQEELGMSSVALKDFPNATFNGFTKRLRPNDTVTILPEYAGYYFRSPKFRATVSSMASMTTRASLNNDMLSALTIIVPPFPEQQAIAAVLSSLDNKIDLLQRQNKTLEALAQTLFRHWFVDGAEDDWEEVALGQMANVKGGKRLPKGEALTDQPTDHPYIRPSDMSSNQILIKELLFVPNEVFPSISNYIVEKGDIIISIVGTIGLCSMVPEELHMASLSENCAKIVDIDANSSNRNFLFYYLISSIGQEEIRSRIVGSTQPKLPLYNIKSISISLPPLSLLNEFDKVAGALQSKISTNNSQIRTLENLRDTLLPKLMSGEVRVSAVSEIAKPESHELFDRADYLAALFADAAQPVAADTAKARTSEQESNIPLAWFAIPETLYQLSEQPFPTPVGQTIYQKLCYVLTDEGVNTGFTFVQHNYGPHSNDAVQALARLETMGMIEQVSIGRMTELRVQALYRSQKTSILEELKQFQPMIARTVELFNHVKDTDHAEEIATILYSARQLEHKLTQRDIRRSELHEYIITWKPHWNRSNKRERLDRAINGLVKMGFISI